MTSVEQKLAAYRARKRQEVVPETSQPDIKANPRGLWGFFEKKKEQSPEPCLQTRARIADPSSTEEEDEDVNADNSPLIRPNGREQLSPNTSQVNTQPGTVESLPVSRYDNSLYIATIVLKFLLWVGLMTIFVKLQFGAVFFIISVFYLICTNLRSRPKQEGEPSAYSVFNPNCEPIDGTIKAEDLEKQLLFLG